MKLKNFTLWLIFYQFPIYLFEFDKFTILKVGRNFGKQNCAELELKAGINFFLKFKETIGFQGAVRPSSVKL